MPEEQEYTILLLPNLIINLRKLAEEDELVTKKDHANGNYQPIKLSFLVDIKSYF